MSRIGLSLAVLTVLTASCDGGGGASLLVDVKTDLVPFVEFDAVVTDRLDRPLGGPEPSVLDSRNQGLDATMDFRAGVRAAEFDGIESGEQVIRVRLTFRGETVIDKVAIVRVAGPTGVTLLLTRDCIGVVCPGDLAAPMFTQCLGGRCVDATCTEENPSACGTPECDSAADCSPGVYCATAECTLGVCVEFSEPDSCPPTHACLPEQGCVRTTPDALVGGRHHICALRDDGTARCWGDNFSGQLGDGRRANYGDDEPATDAPVIDLGTPIVQIAPGDQHTCALDAVGDVRCWGTGSALGNPALPTPWLASSVPPVALGGVAVALSAGPSSSCARLEGGELQCWGDDLARTPFLEVGDDETPADTPPIDLGAAVVRVATGWSNTCAILTDGRLLCYGDSLDGKLGVATVADVGREAPPALDSALDFGEPVVDVTIGRRFMCALLASGDVRCWGSDDMLGTGATDPVGDDERADAGGMAVPLEGPAIEVEASSDLVCALLESGAVHCWGAVTEAVEAGSLGTPGAGRSVRTYGAVALGEPAVDIAVAARGGCARLASGGVRCWGDSSYGYNASGTGFTVIGDDDAPSSVPALDFGNLRSLATGTHRSYAVLDDGTLHLWGRDNAVTTGRIVAAPDLTPLLLTNVTAAATAAQQACFIRGMGTVHCVGSNDSGFAGLANGDEFITIDETATQSVSLGELAVEIRVSSDFACAVLESGAVRCWGAAGNGRLGLGAVEMIGRDDVPTDHPPVDLGASARTLAVGSRHSCAVLATDELVCWGGGIFGQLGYGDAENIGDDEAPASRGPVLLPNPVRSVAVGGRHTCAVLQDDTLYCWGEADRGCLGRGDGSGARVYAPAGAPVDVGGPVDRVVAGAYFTCALLTDGNVRCWGDGAGGATGFGDTRITGIDEVPASLPTLDLGGAVVELVAGGDHAHAIMADGTVRSWGYGPNGLLGLGLTEHVGDDEEPSSTPAFEP